MSTTQRTPRYIATVDHTSDEGIEYIRQLRADNRVANRRRRVKRIIKLYGRGPRVSTAIKTGKPRDYYHYRHVPLRYATHVDVYEYKANW